MLLLKPCQLLNSSYAHGPTNSLPLQHPVGPAQGLQYVGPEGTLAYYLVPELSLVHRVVGPGVVLYLMGESLMKSSFSALYL